MKTSMFGPSIQKVTVFAMGRYSVNGMLTPFFKTAPRRVSSAKMTLLDRRRKYVAANQGVPFSSLIKGLSIMLWSLT